MKAALVYSRFARSFWSFEEALRRYAPKNRFGLPRVTMPSLGLLGLGNHLRHHRKGYYEEVCFIDRNVDPRPLARLLADVDHVYLGGMIAQQEAYLEDARTVKSLGKTLIAGGTIVDESHPIANIADRLVKNEAEMVIDDLLEGLFARDDARLYQGPLAPAEKFFVPDYGLIPELEDYISLPMQLTRGCPFACEFCDIPGRFGSRPRVTVAEHVERMLTQLRQLDFRGSLFIVDDNLIGKPREVTEQLRFMRQVEQRLDYQWKKYSEASLNLMDDQQQMRDLVDEIRQSNFSHLFVGVETDDEEALAATAKTQNLRGSLTPVIEELSRRTGAEIMAGMIIGFDVDTPETARKQIDFINGLPVPIAMLSPLSALINTKLYERLQLEGRLFAESCGNNSAGTTNFIPMNMSERELEHKYLEVLEGINDPDAFFGRVLKSLRLINPATKEVSIPLYEKLYAIVTILAGVDGAVSRKYLRKAHRIAKQRFGFGSRGYQFILSEYMTHCARFTHMRSETERVRRELGERTYEPWQLVSWLQVQEAGHEIIELTDPRPAEVAAAPRQTLTDAGEELQAPERADWNQSVRMVLAAGYEYVGSRFGALAHFVEPHLKRGYEALQQELQRLNRRRPTAEQLWQVVVEAYNKAHLERPDILKSVSLPALRAAITARIGDAQQAHARLFHLYRTVETLSKLRAESYSTP